MQTKWRRTTALALFSGAIAITTAAPAHAQPKAPVSAAAKDAARRDYKAAEAKFAQGQYTAALKLYEAAEAIVPVPQTKYKIAVCRDKLNQVPDAIRWYQTFLDAVPPEKADKLADSIADARARLSSLKMTPAVVRLFVSPPAPRLAVSVDGAPPQGVGQTVGLAPGHHRLVFTADGFDGVAAEVDVAPADAKEVRVTLQATRPGAVAVVPPPVAPPVGPPGEPPPALPPPPPSSRRSNVPAYVLMGLGGAGLVVGAAFGALALKDKSNFNSHPTTSGADTTHTHALIADVSFAAGGALAVTGIVLLVTNLPKQGETTGRAYITPYAGPGGAGATAGLSF